MLENSAEPLSADDLVAAFRWVIDLRPDTQRRFVLQTLVRAAAVVVVEVRRRDVIEMPQPEDNESVEAFTSNRADPTLDERVLIRRPRGGWLYRDASIGEDFVETLGVLEVEVSHQVADRQVQSPSLLQHRFGLSRDPFVVRLQGGRRADHPPRVDVQEGKHVRLPKAGARHDHLREKITLPKTLGVDLDEVVPGARSSFRARVNTFFLKNRSDGRATNAADPQLSQLTNDPTVSPLVLLGETDDDLPNRLGGAFAAHLLRGRLPLASPLQPAAVSSGVNDRHQLQCV